jgi:hypothetical protein
VSALVAGLRRGWLALALGLFCFVLAVPAFQDLERLLIGLGVLCVLLGVAITGFTAAQTDRAQRD